MGRTIAAGLVVGIACVVLARPAAAADGVGDDDASQAFVPGARGRRVPIQPFGFRVYGLFDANAMLAVNTFKAVVGRSLLTAPGGGGDVIWRHWFARVAVSHMRRSGTRAFVSDGQVFSLGIPVTEDLTPIEVGGGWRSSPNPRAPWSAYLGAGLYRLHYKESSDFAQPGDDTDETINGYNAFAGVDIRVLKWISVGAEGQFRSVPNAIGGSNAATGSPAQAYGETNLGGGTFRVMVGIGH